jgi:hypothetical protein
MKYELALFGALNLWLVVASPLLAASETNGPRPMWFNPYELPSHSSTSKALTQDEPLNAVFTRFYTNLEVPESYIPATSTTVDFGVDPTGKIFLSRPRGDDSDKQTWCTFLDASIMTAAIPVKITPKHQAWFDENGMKANMYFELQPKLKQGSKGVNRINQIRSLLPDDKKSFVVIRAIPKQILESNPGLISEEELNASTNFRLIDPSNINLETLQSLRKPWAELYSSSKPYTKIEVQAVRDKVDRDFGSIIAPIPST